MVATISDIGNSTVPFTFKNGSMELLLEGDLMCIFVLDAKGNLFIAPEKLKSPNEVQSSKFQDQLKGVIHHSSFTNGKSAQATGKMRMTPEGVLLVTPSSGHYRQTTQELKPLLSVFLEKGVKPEKIINHIHICDLDEMHEPEIQKDMLVSLGIKIN